MHNLIYAGIGPRKTPREVLKMMEQVAHGLSPTGWLLRSGGVIGADLAFERCAIHKEIHLPWNRYNGKLVDNKTYFLPPITPAIEAIAATHHPVYWSLKSSVKMFMCRNVTIILGMDLQTPVKMVVCYTPEGKAQGGTGHGIRVAKANDIPVFDLAKIEDQNALCKFVLQY